MKRPHLLPLLTAALAAVFVPFAHAATEQPALTLERIYADPPLTGLLPRGASISPGGKWVSYLRASATDSEVIELWAQPLDGGAARKLVAVADLIGQQKATLTEAEKMALERRRIQGRGITSFQWCGADDTRLIVPLSGDLYAVTLTASGVTTQRLPKEAGEPAREPQCDKAGQKIAFVKGGDLWVQALDGGAARRLTSTGSATRTTGLAEFIAEEELSRHKGFWWSPDGMRLLAIESDESGVPVKVRAQIFADRTAMTEQRYPAAGEANAKLRALVIEADGSATQALTLPAESEYI
ncbi:MAG TPA: DPP IV N-terminal domain-containing protein, partial [Burkholderiaceae bacterium]